jgi:succinoglycan biosynthesis protein ExoM
MLTEAVRSLTRQECGGRDFEIVVVDNSVDGRWRDFVASLAGEFDRPIRYVGDPSLNVASARNAGMRATSARTIVFLDDDEEAQPGWLAALLATQERHDADAVFGPTRPIFENDRPPAWDPHGATYGCQLDLRTGDIVAAAGSGNMLIRRDANSAAAEEFDVRFGRTGGADTELCLRLTRRGKKLVWCEEAEVREAVPPHRAGFSWRAVRQYRQSQVYVRAALKNSDLPAAKAARLMALGAVQAVVASLSWLVPMRIAPFAIGRGRLMFCNGMGKTLWMLGASRRGVGV